MHPRSVRSMGLLVVTALLIASLSSCATTAPGPVVVLPSNYYLTPDKTGQTELVKAGGSPILPAPVAAYAVYGHIVAGALGKAPTWSGLYTDDRAFVGGPDTRYFILDTFNGRLESDLTAARWHERLQSLGVPKAFDIYPLPPWNPQPLAAGG